MIDYVDRLKSDLLEQFKGRPKIEALLEVIGKQFNDVYRFYKQLQMETDVHTAIGKQLDGIGDIVAMTRAEAMQYIPDVELVELLDDETFRQYLIYKILQNTTNCTYQNIVKAFKMFWEHTLYYREDPAEPATMTFDTGEVQGLVDTSPLFRTPLIRAAGVRLKITAQTSAPADQYGVRIFADLGHATTETPIPTIK